MNTETSNPLISRSAGWIGEDSTRHPALVPEGYASRLDNLLCLNGETRVRHGISRPDWGCPFWDYQYVTCTYNVEIGSATMQLSGGSLTPAIAADIILGQAISGAGIALGATIIAVNAAALQVTMSAVATFTASATVFPQLTRAIFTPQDAWIHALRYSDTIGTDSLVVLVNGRRSDGGNGRCFRLIAGSLAREIPLNGFDLWPGARLVPCGVNGLLLLRPQKRRWYFDDSDVDLATNQITLHVTPSLIAGSQVSFHLADGDTGSLDPLVQETTYWISIAGAAVRLHPTRADALAGANQIDLTAKATNGWWYLELEDPDVAPEINWGETLILQPTTALEMWDVGWTVVPVQLAVTDATVATDVWTVPNHRLVAGDKIKFRSVAGGLTTNPVIVAGTTEWWVAIESDHTVKMYTSQEGALERDASKVVDITVTGTAVIKKAGASDLPIPPARLGLYHRGRVILVTGNDHLIVSDTNDPIHYAPLTSETRIEEGLGKPIVALAPYLNDSMIVFKATEIYEVTGISGDIANWQVGNVTSDYGCPAEFGWTANGNDLWFATLTGIATVQQTEFGQTQGQVIPASEAIQARINAIDWKAAAQIVAAKWNNLVFFAVPELGQSEPVRNNSVLVYSTVNKAWQGKWSGDTLRLVQFVNYAIAGRQILGWLDPSGWFRYFREDKLVDNRSDGYDLEAPIAHSIEAKAILAPAGADAVADGFHLALSTWNPVLDVVLIPDGVGTERTLLRQPWTRDRTRYRQYGHADYDATNVNDDWGAPGRMDYSVPLNFYPGDNGVRGNQHQETRLKVMCNRAAGDPVLFRLAATQGSVRLRAITAAAEVGRVNGREDP